MFAPVSAASAILASLPANATARPKTAAAFPASTSCSRPAATRTTPVNHEAQAWLDDYDPAAFDEWPVKYALGPIAARRNATAARLLKPKT